MGVHHGQRVAWGILYARSFVTLRLPAAPTMEDMTGVHSREQQRQARWLLRSLPPIILATTFVQLYITFLVIRSLAPDLLGQVATRPAVFAVLIALVALPLRLVVALAFAWRLVRTALTGAELHMAPRTRWRQIGGYVIDVPADIGAALIVFKAIAHPSATPFVPLLMVVVLGPIVLFWLLKGLGVLCRWGWRRWTNRGYQPRHPASAD